MKSSSLFASGFVQVALITAQSLMIIERSVPGVFVVGFAISLLWTWNVRSIAFGTLRLRLAYALGAGTGSAAVLIGGRLLG